MSMPATRVDLDAKKNFNESKATVRHTEADAYGQKNYRSPIN